MKEKTKNLILTILLCLSLFAFCFSLFQVIKIYFTGKNEQKVFDSLKQTVEIKRTVSAEEKNEIKAEEPKESQVKELVILPEYAEIYENNKDFFGWLKIEDTVIDYPVMFTPEDMEYYIHRAFDKSKSNSGTPFMDGSYFDGCGIYLIYGHHMKNGTMFGKLPEYADESYYASHRIIEFDTLYERGKYEVISAFYSKVYDDDETGFRYYDYKDLSDEEIFDEYVEQIKLNSIYDTEVDAKFGEQLLVLSTCNYHTKDGRFVVVAKKMLP